MSDKIHVRCSKLPLHFKCPGSARPAQVPVDEANEAAEVGTAAHDGLVPLVRDGAIEWEGVPELARKHGVDEKELRVLLALGQKIWAQVRDCYPNASAEVELRHEIGRLVITGHADIMSFDAPSQTLRAADWKGGRLDSDYREQLLGYLALGLLKIESALRAEGCILWLRDGDGESYSMDRAQLLEWMVRIENEIVNWDGVYRPGAHCQYCPRSHECSAANALARRDMAVLLDKDLPGHLEDAETIAQLRVSNPDLLVELLEKARRVSKMAERVESAIKSDVVKSGDLVGGEKLLTLQERTTRALDTGAAFDVLQDAINDADKFAEVMTLSLPKAEDIVAAKAGKGNGVRAKKDLEEKLVKAGAIRTNTIKALVVRRTA